MVVLFSCYETRSTLALQNKNYFSKREIVKMQCYLNITFKTYPGMTPSENKWQTTLIDRFMLSQITNLCNFKQNF